MKPELFRGSLRVLMLCLFAFALPDVGLAQGEIRPILNCIEYVPEEGKIVAYFGYSSSFTTPVTLEAGEEGNFFFPGPQNRNQPTVFHPGVHDRVFATSFVLNPLTPQLTWFLGEK